MKNYCEWCHQADDWLCPKIEITPKIGNLVHCPKCNREILLVTVTRAARVAGVSAQTIYDWIRKGWINVVVIAACRNMICYSSLYQPPKPRTEEEAYVDALSERARSVRLKVYKGKAA